MNALESITQMMTRENRAEASIEDLTRSLGANVEDVRDLWDAMTLPEEAFELQCRMADDLAFCCMLTRAIEILASVAAPIDRYSSFC